MGARGEGDSVLMWGPFGRPAIHCNEGPLTLRARCILMILCEKIFYVDGR